MLSKGFVEGKELDMMLREDRIRLWKEIWCEETSLRMAFPSLIELGDDRMSW